MTELKKEETHNFMCRLSKEDYRKLKIIADAKNRSMTSQIRQFIQDNYRDHINQNNVANPLNNKSLNHIAG